MNREAKQIVRVRTAWSYYRCAMHCMGLSPDHWRQWARSEVKVLRAVRAYEYRLH